MFKTLGYKLQNVAHNHSKNKWSSFIFYFFLHFFLTFSKNTNVFMPTKLFNQIYISIKKGKRKLRIFIKMVSNQSYIRGN